MSRYIDIEPIEKEIERELTIGEIKILSEYQKGVLDVYDAIKKTPTADVVEVVRCKDCKYARKVRNRNREDCDYICCCFRDNPDKMDVVDYYRFMVRPDGYCYRGAKMDKEKEE